MGVLDIDCRQHDICYVKCREQFSYSELEKYNCMVRCDDTLMSTSKNIQHDPNSSSWFFYKALGPELAKIHYLPIKPLKNIYKPYVILWKSVNIFYYIYLYNLIYHKPLDFRIN